MANNRLYLVDTGTYEWILLAKGWSSGWQYWDKTPIEAFLEYTSEVLEPRDMMAARGDEKTKLAVFTEADLPKQCGPNAWVPKIRLSDD
jgi:hypothetical protein